MTAWEGRGRALIVRGGRMADVAEAAVSALRGLTIRPSEARPSTPEGPSRGDRLRGR